MKKQQNNLYFNKLYNSKSDFYDTLLYQYNSCIYSYGNHLKENVKNFKRNYRSIIYRLFSLCFLLRKKTERGKFYLNNSYVDLNLPLLKPCLPPWCISFKKEVYLERKLSDIIFKMFRTIEKQSIKLLVSAEFEGLLKEYSKEFGKMIVNDKLSFLMVPNDMSLFENLTIKVCQDNNIPTFVYLHGLPARFNLIDDNRADFLIVWGKGLKNSYVNAGFNPDKILTIKHPLYSNFKLDRLRSNLKDVLVITKAMPGAPISSLEMILTDRSNSLYYVESVKQILLKLGVQSARLRLHPSENPSFYNENLTDDFYTIDSLDKTSSLNNSTLVVGPTSTMLLDALKHNVNYILYDPVINSKTLDFEQQLVAPFDGSSFINLSLTIEDFTENIFNPNSNVSEDILNEYLNIDDHDYKRFLEIVA
ncbi:MAG TPA: hypothetical protein VL125_08710 [Pelobium sp.]|nr:hypothetical protein [Pelobium sp.]